MTAENHAIDRPFLDFEPEPTAKALPIAIPARHAAIEIPTVPRHAIDVDELFRCVAQSYRIPVTLLLSDDRHKNTAEARQVTQWLMRELGGMSYPEIGRAMHGRHHTTVMSNVRKILRRREESAAFETFTDQLREAVAVRVGGGK